MRWWARGPLFPFLSVCLVAMALLMALSLRRPRARAFPPSCSPALLEAPDAALWADTRSGGPFAAPMPALPLEGQLTPPCRPPLEVEENGACWVLTTVKPPCPRGSYMKHDGCYIPAFARARPPVSSPNP